MICHMSPIVQHYYVCSYVNTAEITSSFNHLAIYNDNGYESLQQY